MGVYEFTTTGKGEQLTRETRNSTCLTNNMHYLMSHVGS